MQLTTHATSHGAMRCTHGNMQMIADHRRRQLGDDEGDDLQPRRVPKAQLRVRPPQAVGGRAPVLQGGVPDTGVPPPQGRGTY